MYIDMNEALQGLKLIDLTRVRSGPSAVRQFADWGADVIKVEPPQGDYIRQMTWPIIDGVSLLHLHTHRGKKSVAMFEF